MLKKDYRRWGVCVCLSLVAWAGYAQYTVNGGRGTPLRALDDTRNRLEVYLVYGMENVEISYTSSSASHQWFRYKTNALEAEPVDCTQNGMTSTIRGMEEGYGYFVSEAGVLTRYVWLTDYSRYLFTPGRLQVVADDPCAGVRLTDDAGIPALTYYTPNGLPVRLNRSFDISYRTMEWSETDRYFTPAEVNRTVEGDPFEVFLEPPLCDTEFHLQGDSFARHFGVEQSARTETYEAVAVRVHADTTLVASDAPNMSSGDGQGLSAPATVVFTAHANNPVAALYRWTIYRKGEEESGDKLIRTGEEVEHTFTRAGEYVAELEVTNRTAVCTDVSQSFTLQISETVLEAPNAFSPGSTPGVNDEFRVIFKSVNKFRGWIFNRWGTEMFRWDNPAVGWDGKKGGRFVPTGVYFYVIEYEDSLGKPRKKTGSINILRSKTIQNEVTEE